MYVVKEESERYETVDTLAEGAMGSVHLARDHVLDRFVAIKTVNPPPGSGPEERQRLQDALEREAQLVQLLSHPNIVTVHEFRVGVGDHPPALIMEYVQGNSLGDFLKSGTPLPVDFVVSIATQIADALGHAHSMGVIHGDIKPSNVLISDDGESAKIVDFGIARLAGHDGIRDQRLLGTPRYVAPELLRGGVADQRSDLFSLGVVLYEMLTGRSPFRGDTPREITQQIAGGRADLSTEALTEVPDVFLPVLEKSLQDIPANRFQSAREFADALHRPESLGEGPEVAATQDLSALVVPDIQDLDPAEELVQPSDLQAENPNVQPPPAAVFITREPPSYQRLAIAGAIAAALTIVIGLVVLWIASPEGPIDGRPSTEHKLRTTVFPLLQESRRQLRAGEAEVAIRILRRAQSLNPGNSRIGELIANAESEARGLKVDQERSRELESLLTQSRDALDAGSPQRALRLAMQALAIEPEDPEARTLMDAAQAKRYKPATNHVPVESAKMPEEEPVTPVMTQITTPKPRSAPIVSVPTPPRPETRPPPRQTPTSSTSDLRLDVFSYLSKGVLTVYADREQILLEPFKFVQKSGLIRKKKTAGRLEKSLRLPAGQIEFRIYISAVGHETQSVALDAELAGGQTHVLRLIIAENGSASAQLN